MIPNPLFSQGSLTQTIEATANAVTTSLKEWNPDDLLTRSTADVLDELIDRHSIDCPVLRRDEAFAHPSEEVVERADVATARGRLA